MRSRQLGTLTVHTRHAVGAHSWFSSDSREQNVLEAAAAQSTRTEHRRVAAQVRARGETGGLPRCPTQHQRTRPATAPWPPSCSPACQFCGCFWGFCYVLERGCRQRRPTDVQRGVMRTLHGAGGGRPAGDAEEAAHCCAGWPRWCSMSTRRASWMRDSSSCGDSSRCSSSVWSMPSSSMPVILPASGA